MEAEHSRANAGNVISRHFEYIDALYAMKTSTYDQELFLVVIPHIYVLNYIHKCGQMIKMCVTVITAVTAITKGSPSGDSSKWYFEQYPLVTVWHVCFRTCVIDLFPIGNL